MGSGGNGVETTGLGSCEVMTGIGSGGVWPNATGASQIAAPLAAKAVKIRPEGSYIRIAPNFALSPGMGYRAVTRSSHLL
jgi:hypothetical protein